MSAYQMVPVPETAIPAVYRLLADLASPVTPEARANPVVEDLTRDMPEEEYDGDDGVIVEGNGWWWPDHILELAPMLKNPAGIEMMNAIAENSLEDRPTTYEDLRAAGQSAVDTEFGYDNVRAQLSWIAKYSKKVIGDNVWPLELTDHGPEAEKGTRYQYRMPPSLARTWLNVRG